MISVNNVVRQGLQRSYVARNGGSGTFYEFIPSQTATGHSGPSLERSWLTAKGGTGISNQSLWDSYLTSKGFTTGSLKERMRSFFTTGTQA